MRIKKIDINKYGPLRKFRHDCEDINLFFGNNESGKTALIDIFIESLFKSNRKIFKNSGRFNSGDSFNAGEFVIEFKSGKYVFPSDEVDLHELLELPDIELSRLFIIRAGDLKLKRSERWWPAIKQFLTNLNTDLIKVKEYIYTNVGLTKSGQKWSSAGKNSKKKYIDTIENRLGELKKVREKLKQISQEEEMFKKKREEFNNKRDRLEKLKKVKRYSKYKEAKDLLEKYIENKQKLQELDRYETKDKKKWQNLRDKLSELKLQRQSYENSLKKKRDDIDKIKKEKLEIIKERLEKFKKIKLLKQKKGFENPLFRFIFSYFHTRNVVKYITYVFLLFAFFAFLFLKEISDANIYLILALGSIILLFAIWFLQFIVGKRLKEIKFAVKDMVFEDSNIKVMSEMFEIDNKIIELKSAYSTYKETLKGTQKDEKKIDKQLEICNVNVKKQQERLDEIRRKTGKGKFEQLIDVLEKKKDLNHEKEKIEGRLKDILGDSNESNWSILIDNIKIAPPEEKVDFSLKHEEKLREELEKLEQDKRKIEREIERFYNNLQDSLNIQNIREVYSEISKLEKEKKDVYLEKKAALLSGEIINDFSNSFDLQLTEILGTGTATVSEYFNKFTHGKYVLVEFRDKKFVVTDNNGNKYAFSELSTGTQDQLMFSIRIAFLLRGFKEPGFLILDDAFLTSDYKRRESLVKCINELVKRGWQIFYLTIDEHIKDLFMDICKVKANSLN